MASEYVTIRKARCYTVDELADIIGFDIPDGAVPFIEAPGNATVTIGYNQKKREDL